MGMSTAILLTVRVDEFRKMSNENNTATVLHASSFVGVALWDSESFGTVLVSGFLASAYGYALKHQ